MIYLYLNNNTVHARTYKTKGAPMVEQSVLIDALIAEERKTLQALVTDRSHAIVKMAIGAYLGAAGAA